MSRTNFPNGITSMGVPIPGHLGWKRGAYTWFVDGTQGSDGNGGRDAENAFSTIGKAISMASAYDVIYVLDKGNSSTDPNPYQETSANLSIAYAKNNLALIGVPANIHQTFGLQVKNLSDATTTPVLTVKAPFCTIENLDFNKGGGGVGSCISLLDDGDTTNLALGSSVYNCHLRNSARGSAARTAAGGVYIVGGWYYTIKGCYFMDNTTGVYMTSGTSTLKGITIQDCIFNGALANLDTDIYTAGTSYNLTVDNCTFAHDIPAFAGAGALTAYIYDVVSAPASITRCTFATDDASCKDTVTNEIVTLAGNTIVGCYDAAGLVAWA